MRYKKQPVVCPEPAIACASARDPVVTLGSIAISPEPAGATASARNPIVTISERSTEQALPCIILQAVIVPSDITKEGQLVKAVALPWFKIIEWIERDPNVIYQLGWRKWEEIIAGAYTQQGCEVILTPRSNDRGRDVIAIYQGIGSIKIFDQVKAYKPGHLVEAKDIREIMGVLTFESNVSKGIITTTSDFAPGVYKDEDIQRFTPYRLELKPKHALLEWLSSIYHQK